MARRRSRAARARSVGDGIARRPRPPSGRRRCARRRATSAQDGNSLARLVAARTAARRARAPRARRCSAISVRSCVASGSPSLPPGCDARIRAAARRASVYGSTAYVGFAAHRAREVGGIHPLRLEPALAERDGDLVVERAQELARPRNLRAPSERVAARASVAPASTTTRCAASRASGLLDGCGGAGAASAQARLPPPQASSERDERAEQSMESPHGCQGGSAGKLTAAPERSADADARVDVDPLASALAKLAACPPPSPRAARHARRRRARLAARRPRRRRRVRPCSRSRRGENVSAAWLLVGRGLHLRRRLPLLQRVHRGEGLRARRRRARRRPSG